MISLQKWYILTPLQKLPENVGRFGQINCYKRPEKSKVNGEAISSRSHEQVLE